jgi:protease-4
MTQRGDEIELSREEVSRAKVYLGTEAVENGFADELGFVDDAIADVAERANLDSYDVDIRRAESQQSLLGGLPLGESNGETVVTVERDDGLSRQLVLAVAPQFVERAVGDDVEIVYHSGEYLATENRPADGQSTDNGGDDG